MTETWKKNPVLTEYVLCKCVRGKKHGKKKKENDTKWVSPVIRRYDGLSAYNVVWRATSPLNVSRVCRIYFYINDPFAWEAGKHSLSKSNEMREKKNAIFSSLYARLLHIDMVAGIITTSSRQPFGTVFSAHIVVGTIVRNLCGRRGRARRGICLPPRLDLKYDFEKV